MGKEEREGRRIEEEDEARERNARGKREEAREEEEVRDKNREKIQAVDCFFFSY